MTTISVLQGQTCIFSDEFEGMTLDPSWQHFQHQYYSDTIVDNKLEFTIDAVVCNNNCPWFNSQSAGFIYKVVSGNFDIEARAESVIARGANQGQDINNDTQLAGIMVRDGNTSSENYIFNVVGTRFDIPSIETKTTVNGSSSGGIQHFPINSTTADLRMIREDSLFLLYSRDIGATSWILRSSIIRTDLPNTIQLGLIAYAFQSYPVALKAKFDYIRVQELAQQNEWIGDNGFWDEPNNWSLGIIPNANHHVLFDNAMAQSITIKPTQEFDCYNISITNDSTTINIEGVLNVKSDTGCN